MANSETTRRLPDRLLGSLILTGALFLVALLAGWDGLEMLAGIAFLLLVAMFSFRAIVRSVWLFR